MAWDKGSWQPEIEDVDAAMQRGELIFVLNGKKLKGLWALVRIRNSRGSCGQESWLLIKRRDSFASRKDITAAERFSVVSKRTLAQIANDEGRNVESAAIGDPQHAINTK